MNAFALHDVSDQAAVRRWGASAFAIVGRACGADRVGDELVHPAAGARRHPACDHGRHGAGFLRAAADADGSRAGTRDAAGRCLAAGARGCGSRAGTDRADPAAGEAGSRRAAGAEGGNEAGEAGARQGRSRRPSRRRSSQKWFARTRRSRPTRRLRRARRPRPGPSARRRPRPPSAPAHRRRRLPPTGRWSPRICSASSNTRPPPRPRASRAPRGSASRSAEAVQVLSAGLGGSSGHSGAGCRDAGDDAPRPAVSRIPAGCEAGLDAVSARRWRSISAELIPSPRPSATTRSNPRTANKTARPAASRAASPPSARPTGRRRR